MRYARPPGTNISFKSEAQHSPSWTEYLFKISSSLPGKTAGSPAPWHSPGRLAERQPSAFCCCVPSPGSADSREHGPGCTCTRSCISSMCSSRPWEEERAGVTHEGKKTAASPQTSLLKLYSCAPSQSRRLFWCCWEHLHISAALFVHGLPPLRFLRQIVRPNRREAASAVYCRWSTGRWGLLSNATVLAADARPGQDLRAGRCAAFPSLPDLCVKNWQKLWKHSNVMYLVIVSVDWSRSSPDNWLLAHLIWLSLYN